MAVAGERGGEDEEWHTLGAAGLLGLAEQRKRTRRKGRGMLNAISTRYCINRDAGRRICCEIQRFLEEGNFQWEISGQHYGADIAMVTSKSEGGLSFSLLSALHLLDRKSVV